MRGSRPGVSTILGTLIFVGILFSAYIPMQLVMKQADNIALQQTHEVQIADQEQMDESIEVYPVPLQGLDQMNVTIINKSEFPVGIVRIWVNNTYHSMEETIESLGSITVGPFDVVTFDGVEYIIKAVTDRGNVFVSEIGTIFYTGGDWSSETLGFRLIFPSRPGRGQRTNDWLNEVMVSIKEGTDYLYTNDTMFWAVSASENFYEVDRAATYDVMVYILCKPPPSQNWALIYDDAHQITWPVGDPVVVLDFVIDGDQLILE